MGIAASYTGLDFSEALLREAQSAVAQALEANFAAADPVPHFVQADLLQCGWEASFEPGSCDGILSFAVLHHIPGSQRRRHLLDALHTLLKPGASFIFSVWCSLSSVGVT